MLASRFSKPISAGELLMCIFVLAIDPMVFTVGRRQASEFLAKFAAAVKKLPLRESQRYVPKNMKFTASDMYVSTLQSPMHCLCLFLFQRHVENHANALLDLDFTPGETLGIWLPDGAERVSNEVLIFFIGNCCSACFIDGCRKSWLERCRN